MPGELVKHRKVSGVFRVHEVDESETLVYGGVTPAWRTFRTADLVTKVRDRDRLAFERLLERQAELADRIPKARGRLRT